MKKQNRFEFKYVMTKQKAQLIERYLDRVGIKRDAQGENGAYIVVSLYCDTPYREDYYDKLSGLAHRRKLRFRIYDETFVGAPPQVWLEVKEKHDMTIQKQRVAIAGNEWSQIFSNKTAGTANVVAWLQMKAPAFAYLFAQKNYRPQVIVQYRRKAYVGEFTAPFRLTFDDDIVACRWREFQQSGAPFTSVLREKVVMEVKFRDALPWWFGDIVYRFQLSRQAFSKYTYAVDALNRFNLLPR